VAEPLLLTRDLSQPIGDVRWPAGVALTPFSAPLAPKAHELMKLAYTNGYGSVPGDFDTWRAATRHDSEFDANLCFCATQDDEHLVGFALCWTSAFVKDLVVHPFVRNQGVGEALLRTAFRAFKQRGATDVRLKVQPDNMTARRLYVRVGFRKG
jgi:ribosomal protein S18 acetylase RimI-like enzyme